MRKGGVTTASIVLIRFLVLFLLVASLSFSIPVSETLPSDSLGGSSSTTHSQTACDTTEEDSPICQDTMASKSEEQAEITAEWDLMAESWDDLAAPYRDSFLEALWDHTGISEEDRSGLVVLDFGCGSGLVTEKIQNQVAKVVCVDASPKMIEQVQDKIRSRQWENVVAHAAVISEPGTDLKDDEFDLIVASSVFTFVPDLPPTMKVLAGLLRSGGGLLCHSDWPHDPIKSPNGFTKESAIKMYEEAGLQPKSTQTIEMSMGDEKIPVFVGVAEKP